MYLLHAGIHLLCTEVCVSLISRHQSHTVVYNLVRARLGSCYALATRSPVLTQTVLLPGHAVRRGADTEHRAGALLQCDVR
eukprot:2328481-Rhodomonas_salina.2